MEEVVDYVIESLVEIYANNIKEVLRIWDLRR